MFHYEAKYYETIKMRQNSGGNNMKMVKHMALPFVTICALVSVTVMAYEANYAGNPVTVTNGWDSRQYIFIDISNGNFVCITVDFIFIFFHCFINL